MRYSFTATQNKLIDKLAQELNDKTAELQQTMVQALYELNAPPNQHIDYNKLFSQRYWDFDPPPPPQEPDTEVPDAKKQLPDG